MISGYELRLSKNLRDDFTQAITNYITEYKIEDQQKNPQRPAKFNYFTLIPEKRLFQIALAEYIKLKLLTDKRHKERLDFFSTRFTGIASLIVRKIRDDEYKKDSLLYQMFNPVYALSNPADSGLYHQFTTTLLHFTEHCYLGRNHNREIFNTVLSDLRDFLQENPIEKFHQDRIENEVYESMNTNIGDKDDASFWRSYSDYQRDIFSAMQERKLTHFPFTTESLIANINCLIGPKQKPILPFPLDESLALKSPTKSKSPTKPFCPSDDSYSYSYFMNPVTSFFGGRQKTNAPTYKTPTPHQN
jgi:hypothetical protein